jgi:hypothetical protein
MITYDYAESYGRKTFYSEAGASVLQRLYYSTAFRVLLTCIPT